jgi:GntR family transcriptional repressor for pyruvate dehydrogenase complex
VAASSTVGGTDTSAGMDLGPVEVPKAAEVLANLLRDRILSGEIAEGETLPPERSLVEQSRLSRASVREALRILKQQGLIVTRPGRGGGSVVARPSADDLVGSLDLYLRGQGWGRGNATLLEAREIIEPWCAALAARRRTDADLQVIDACNAAMRQVIEDLPAYLAANLAWHIAVADASHNELLAAFMHAVSKAVLTQTDSAEFNSPKVRQTAVRAHKRVTEAIRDGDPAQAHRRMATHVHGFGEALMESLGIAQHRDDLQLASPR